MPYKDDHRGPPASAPPSPQVIASLIALDLLLMIFSVVMGLLGNDTVAVAAGAGAIALAPDVARRLLAAPEPAATTEEKD